MKNAVEVLPKAEAWQPHDYQKRGIKFLLKSGSGGLLLDPGMGKTSMSLALFKVLKKKGLAERMLVLGPLRPCQLVWPAEIEKWTDFNEFSYQVVHGRKKEQLLWSRPDITICNYEGLPWLLGAETFKGPNGRNYARVDLRRLRRLNFDLVVFDELSKFKAYNTQRFKMIKQVLHLFRRKIGLTGSPAANGLMGMFGQCYALDEGRTFGQYITHYRNKYFIQGMDGYSWTLQEGAAEKIYKAIRPLMLRMSGEDHLDLPKIVLNDIKLDLPEKVAKIYKALDDDLLAMINTRAVIASNAGVKSGKCRQVASGGIYLDPEVATLVKALKSEREWANLHDVKTDALAELIEELQGSPLLVSYEYKHDLDRILKKLGKDTPYIGGGVSTKRAALLEKQWNRGELPVLLGHPASIGHGLNLQGAGNHICFYTPPWDYELYDQFIRRVRRQGNSSKRVFVHHLIMRGTVDEDVMLSLRKKERGQQSLFAALKERARKRFKNRP